MAVFHVGNQIEVTVDGSPRDRELRAQRSRADVALTADSYDEYEAERVDDEPKHDDEQE